ncbi:uncharacterized protein LOC121051847 [Rosa chinensis]|nr:uncharacterized protein LOC121051847 [Rosa chinensis]
MEDVPELLDQPEVNLDSLFPPLEPQQECRPDVRQSPLSTELGNDPNTNVYYSECSKWQCALGTDDSYLRHLKRISTNDHEKPVRHAMAKFQNRATARTILEVHPQTEDSAELGDALHYNECSELQSPFVDNDSSLTEFLNTCIADEDYYSSEESALIPSKDSNLATKVIRKGQ